MKEEKLWVKHRVGYTAIDPASLICIKGSKLGCLLLFSSKNELLHNRVLYSSKSLMFFEKKFLHYGFIRCHRNYLINPTKITRYLPGENIVQLENEEIRVSKRKTEIIKHMLDKKMFHV